MPTETFDPSAIFAAAAARARASGAPMQGLLTPAEAWQLFAAGAIDLIDTRTLAERDLIGYVPGTEHIEWYDYPGKVRNEHFLDQLRARVEPDRPVAFLCRSGVRSVTPPRLPPPTAIAPRTTFSKDSKATRMPPASAASTDGRWRAFPGRRRDARGGAARAEPARSKDRYSAHDGTTTLGPRHRNIRSTAPGSLCRT